MCRCGFRFWEPSLEKRSRLLRKLAPSSHFQGNIDKWTLTGVPTGRCGILMATTTRSVVPLFVYVILFAAMTYIAKIYHFRLVDEINHYHKIMPNHSILLPPRYRNGHNSLTDGWAGLNQTEASLIDWQEAFLSFRSEMTVCICFVFRPNSEWKHFR